MSRIVIQADGFVNSIPVNPRTPGVFMGVGRTDVMKALFSLATEKGFSVDMEGQHWPTTHASAATMRMASNKMSRGFRRMPGVSRKAR
jgi:hypothetical protein